MPVVNSEEYLTLVAEMENLKSKFTSLELENQRLFGDLQKVTMETQQQQEEFMRRALFDRYIVRQVSGHFINWHSVVVVRSITRDKFSSTE